MVWFGTSSVAKIPIDFSLGHYVDQAPRVAAREVRDCYINTLVGRSDKATVRAVEGYTEVFNQNGVFQDGIIVDEAYFWISGGDLYSVALTALIPSNRGTVGTSSERFKIVANSKNLVILNLDSAATTADYYYDPATTTLATIQSSDADYASFGKAKDVCYKDGYYVFITEDSVFHGDSDATGTGLSFNPLSFDTLPAGFGQGTGVENINGRLHAFLSNSTLFYQTAGTTPFAFQRLASQSLTIGLDDPMGKVKFDDRCLLMAKNQSGIVEPYLLEGNSYQSLGDPSVSDFCANISGRYMLSSYAANGHRFVTIQSNAFTGTPTECYTLDYTELKLRGYPVWHIRGADGESTQYPLKKFLNRQDYAATGTNLLYAAGVTPGGATDMTFYQLDFDDIYSSTKVFTFPYIRNNGEDIFIKSIGLKFTGNVDTAELFSSTDGSTFTSLGSYSLGSYDDKEAVWRKINRYSTDVIFKVQFTATATTTPLSMIEAYAEV